MNSTGGLTLLLEEEQGIFHLETDFISLCVCVRTHHLSLEATRSVQIKFK